MATPPNRALRTVLGILSLLAAVGGLLMIFSGKPLMTRLFLHPPESEMSTLLSLYDSSRDGSVSARGEGRA